ncbi:MAG: hypothetical protein KC505_10615 [Myxococcales bacterium]|nr:hypothetical protein [Myxococcales bacterium]USN51591.1 MAG: hypothetical protein H6731_04050 [Myxococcales bacterium]
MAAPIGHIISALALLNSAPEISNRNEFIAGTSFPDIRYVSDISRKATHYSEDHSLAYVLRTESSFEAGRRFHVFIDHEREKFMRAHDAYRFIKNTSLKTQLLKMVEDEILYPQFKNKINSKEIFSKIYLEEMGYGLSLASINSWHTVLKKYLDDSHWFNISRYYCSLKEFKKVYARSHELFGNFWSGIRTIGFLLYAYVQIVRLTHNEELREIVLKFYNQQLPKRIKEELEHRKSVVLEQVQRPVFWKQKLFNAS